MTQSLFLVSKTKHQDFFVSEILNTPTRRLKSAQGYYGVLGWTYDANGNRLTETANVISTYVYPTNSSRLAAVTTPGRTARAFAYDASGDIVADSRSGALGVVFGYDPEGRLERVKLPNGATTALYRYDPLDHLTSRQLASTGTTTLYIHDASDHIIAETDPAGATRREYIWVGDLPVAVGCSIAKSYGGRLNEGRALVSDHQLRKGSSDLLRYARFNFLVDALGKLRISGHRHLLSSSNGGDELDDKTPWGEEAVGEVIIDVTSLE
jgi:YD repeat-containing protein